MPTLEIEETKADVVGDGNFSKFCDLSSDWMLIFLFLDFCED